jgi:uncharacterized protein
MIVDCPQCGKKVVWDNKNPYRPFCSERCKKMDLGAWAEEKYVIPGTASEPDDLPDEEK